MSEPHHPRPMGGRDPRQEHRVATPLELLFDALNSFQRALTSPEAQQRIEALLKRGLQREVDFAKRWPAVLGMLLEAQSP